MADVSRFKLYSMGVAAENLAIGGTTLQIVPIEHMVFLDGELKSEPTPLTVEGTDASGNSTKTTVTMDNAVEAKWLPWHSNQITAPNIRRGERVFLWRYADRDEFRWTDTGMDRKYRKLETVTYAWNATQDESDNSEDPANHYFVEVSAHKGAITLGTSQANGEKAAYTIQINAKDGNLTIADGLGQIVYVDGVNHVIHAINADQSEVTLNKQVITIQCRDTLNFTALKAFNIQTKTLSIQAETITVNASSQIQITTQTAKLSASTASIDAQSTTVSGITISNGHIQCSGITSSGNVTAPNID